ncbi:MAG: NIPSNAP family protein [Ktedonobacteraceae bacterium]
MSGDKIEPLSIRQEGETCCPIVELRQYTLKPGRREDLIALFEEHFIEGQEQYNMRIIGQFCHRTNADQFVWLRGFADMEARRKALEGFYYGPIWQEHRMAANDTMIDSDNVLLLKPAHTTDSFRLNLAGRPKLDAPEGAGGIITVTVYTFAAPVDAQFIHFFEKDVAPILRESGATILGQFVTEPGENTFPALPIREGEHIFAWLASFSDDTAYTAYCSTLAKHQVWSTALASMLRARLSRPEEVLALVPTRRSLLRHRSRA